MSLYTKTLYLKYNRLYKSRVMNYLSNSYFSLYLVSCYETLRFSLHVIITQLLVSFTLSSLKKGERYWSFCTKSFSDKKTRGYYWFKALFSKKLQTTPYLYLLLSPYKYPHLLHFPTREPGGMVMLKGVVSAETEE